MPLILARLAKVDQLEQLLTRLHATVVSEVETSEALAQLSEATQEAQSPHEPLALLPAVAGVAEADVRSVLEAYLSGVTKRDICTHLHWGAAKYSTIVKPVIAAWETRKQFVSDAKQTA